MTQSSIKRGDIISFPNISRAKWKVLTNPKGGVAKLSSISGKRTIERIVDPIAVFKKNYGVPSKITVKHFKVKKHE